MIRVYCAALIVTAIFLSFMVGKHVANIKCREHMATTNAERIFYDVKFMEKTNDTVFHTGVSDIRRILHEKYTIAE